jgi:hypothetical protein
LWNLKEFWTRKRSDYISSAFPKPYIYFEIVGVLMTTTLAARFYEPRKPLRLEEVSLRNVGDDDLLVEIKAAGVCHSDLHVIDGLFRPKYAPITLGHETSGLVI